jgi:hypothetical protein
MIFCTRWSKAFIQPLLQVEQTHQTTRSASPLFHHTSKSSDSPARTCWWPSFSPLESCHNFRSQARAQMCSSLIGVRPQKMQASAFGSTR